MSTVPTIQILVYFGTTTTASNIFTLDDPVRGLLDSVTYVLGGDTGTDVAQWAQTITINRGKSSLLDEEFNAGTCTIELLNTDRRFDPLYSSGPYYGNLKPGRRVQVLADGVTIFDGRVSDWNLTYEAGNGTNSQSMAVMECEDALATLARKSFTEWTTTAGQTAGPRLTDILNRSEVAWSGGARALDTGVSTLQGDLVTYGSSVLNYCQLVAKSDLGFFFASRTGVITFKDRRSTIGGSVALSIDQGDGGGLPFQDIEITAGSDEYFTRVSVDREGGTAQSYTSALAADEDIITLSISGLLLDSDAQALDMATYIATTLSTGDARISSVTVNLDTRVASTAQIAAALALDIGSLVSVSFTPNGIAPAIVQTGVVIGIRHDPLPEEHVITLTLGKWDGRTPFILDDPVYGVLDGPGVMVF